MKTHPTIEKIIHQLHTNPPKPKPCKIFPDSCTDKTKVYLMFFNDIRRRYGIEPKFDILIDEAVQRLVDDSDIERIYNVWNNPKHSIRNALVTFSWDYPQKIVKDYTGKSKCTNCKHVQTISERFPSLGFIRDDGIYLDEPCHQCGGDLIVRNSHKSERN